MIRNPQGSQHDTSNKNPSMYPPTRKPETIFDKDSAGKDRTTYLINQVYRKDSRHNPHEQPQKDPKKNPKEFRTRIQSRPNPDQARQPEPGPSQPGPGQPEPAQASRAQASPAQASPSQPEPARASQSQPEPARANHQQGICGVFTEIPPIQPG